ncbi:MAG: hypothetical protein KBS62_07885 [Oscillospiraceae bacterium]|nr:hypothetical protein [Candidatus Ruminococcus equi]
MKNKKEVTEVKVCKNKKCQKPLPKGYKHKYCESCRNEWAYRIKQVIKVGASTVVGVIILIITCGKIKPKK